MLYSRYSSPMDLVDRYIRQGRFGKFVQSFMEAEYERKKQEAEKEQELMMWIAWVHSYSDKTFNEYKKQMLQPAQSTTGGDANLTQESARSIMDKLFSHTPTEE